MSNTITRRDTMRRLTTAAVVSATAGSGIVARGALAAAPMAGVQAPGFYRTRVGAFEITTLFVTNPGWHVVFDMDGPQAETSRRALLDRAAADRLRIIGYHFPFPSIGRVAAAPDGFRYVPERWAGTPSSR